MAQSADKSRCFRRGVLYENTGRYDEAEQDYRYVVSLCQLHCADSYDRPPANESGQRDHEQVMSRILASCSILAEDHTCLQALAWKMQDGSGGSAK